MAIVDVESFIDEFGGEPTHRGNQKMCSLAMPVFRRKLCFTFHHQNADRAWRGCRQGPKAPIELIPEDPNRLHLARRAFWRPHYRGPCFTVSATEWTKAALNAERCNSEVSATVLIDPDKIALIAVLLERLSAPLRIGGLKLHGDSL